MLIDQFGRMYIGLLDNGIRLCLCVRKNRIPVGENLLISLDLFRRLHPQLPKKLLDLFLVDNNIGL